MSAAEEQDVFLTIRVPASLKAALSTLAAERDRTIAAEVRLAIKAHLEASA